MTSVHPASLAHLPACRLSLGLAALVLGCWPALASAADSAVAGFPTVRISPADIPNQGVLFVNNEARGGSGHGNQALVECKNGDVISFYPQTAGDVMLGHSTTGWTEYRTSKDRGRTWSAPVVLEYSKAALGGKEVHSALVEEAVTAPDGTVIAFVGRYTTFDWRRTTPVYLRSRDHGKTWGEAKPLDLGQDIAHVGRVHAAFVKGDTLYVLCDSGTHNSQKNGTGHKLYVSTDNGATFTLRSSLPFPEIAWYGTMNVIQGNKLVAYVYRDEDEKNMQYATSEDDGRTWSAVGTTLLTKALRNPQLSSAVNGVYFLHGRSGQRSEDPSNLVLYRSTDGLHWDEGVFLNRGSKDDADSYSTNEVLGKYDAKVSPRLLIQSSVAYDGKRKVNLHHWMVEVPAKKP